MGTVFLARDRQTGDNVAVKMLKAEIVAQNRGLVARFARKGETQRQLNHLNIKLLATVQEDERIQVPAEQFSTAVQRGKALDLDTVVNEILHDA